MESEYEWELIVTPGKEDLVPQLPRKICRTSILSRLSGAYDRCEIGEPPLPGKILNVIPPEGTTAETVSRLLNVDIEAVYCGMNVLKRRGEVVSLKVNGKMTKYYRVDSNILETLELPYRPKYP